MRIVDLDQRTDEWLKWRQQGIGGSDAAVILLGRHFDRTVGDLYTEKTNPPAARKRRDTSAMARGRRLESVAVAIYTKLTGFAPLALCALHATEDWLKASLDGWVEEANLWLEIKAPNKYDHQAALDGCVPEKYVPQCDHLTLVSGAQLGHYVSYNDYFPAMQKFCVVPVPRDEARVAALYAAESDFWRRVQRREPRQEWSEGQYD